MVWRGEGKKRRGEDSEEGELVPREAELPYREVEEGGYERGEERPEDVRWKKLEIGSGYWVGAYRGRRQRGSSGGRGQSLALGALGRVRGRRRGRLRGAGRRRAAARWAACPVGY